MFSTRWRRARFLLVGLVVLGVVAASAVWARTSESRQIASTAQGQRFNFVAWLATVWRDKAEAALVAAPALLDAEAQRQVVLDYLAALGAARSLARQIEVAYAQAADGHADTRDLEAQLAERRAASERLQATAEAILERQIASVLADEGFAPAGTPFPPVQMRITPLPTMLIVSPRTRIEQIHAFPLQPGLTAAERDAIETAIAERFDLSALVVNIGGLAVYPAMIIESTDLVFLTDVMAHEWAHHWLVFRPLGYRYLQHPETRVINETVAGVFGREIGRLVLERYYPELVPPLPEEQPDPPPAAPETPPAFDFRLAMRETRVQVDALLAAGDVAGAEAYMEERRQLFVANGYLLRRLNQAYFAFHGAYADSPGASGEDPIGPAVLALREQAPSLRAFMDAIARATTTADLQRALGE